MKLIDRIRTIADSPEYRLFAHLWNAFEPIRTGKPGDVAQMITLGNGLHRRVMERAAEHAKAQVRSPLSLTETQADLLIAEAKHGAQRAIRKLMPELAAYADFIETTLRDRARHSPRRTAEAM